jgi:hypothetical protein
MLHLQHLATHQYGMPNSLVGNKHHIIVLKPLWASSKYALRTCNNKPRPCSSLKSYVQHMFIHLSNKTIKATVTTDWLQDFYYILNVQKKEKVFII